MQLLESFLPCFQVPARMMGGGTGREREDERWARAGDATMRREAREPGIVCNRHTHPAIGSPTGQRQREEGRGLSEKQGMSRGGERAISKAGNEGCQANSMRAAVVAHHFPIM